jgi:membrane-bound lytic murein transglycosylase D
LLKKVGFTLLMAALEPAAVFAFTPADTSRFAAIGEGLSNPMLLSGDSIRRAMPVYFCGEEVPVEIGSVARRWRQTLMNYGAQRESLYQLRKRAAAFFPVIEPVLAKYSIPEDFRFLPLAESCLENDCVSPKGAAGYWQLMPGTARELGLIVDGDVDERLNLKKATIAVCRYLRDLHRQLGSWTLVAAAYNGGPNHVQQRMDSQHQSSYYRLRLHEETNMYLFRILAYKELFTNPAQYKQLLGSGTFGFLTRALPRSIRPLNGEPTKSTEVLLAMAMPDDSSVNPTWGPRVDNSLTEGPTVVETMMTKAEVDAIVARADAPPIDPALGEEEKGTPVKKLLGLFVLRFRRPKRLQKKETTGGRPLHVWDWV